MAPALEQSNSCHIVASEHLSPHGTKRRTQTRNHLSADAIGWHLKMFRGKRTQQHEQKPYQQRREAPRIRESTVPAVPGGDFERGQTRAAHRFCVAHSRVRCRALCCHYRRDGSPPFAGPVLSQRREKSDISRISRENEAIDGHRRLSGLGNAIRIQDPKTAACGDPGLGAGM